jgi:large subunit ribosomal protein L15
MQIHNVQRRTPNTFSRQIGRGGKRGKTSGRGHKGQKARAGHKIRPEIRDRIKKIPKLRGYRFASIQSAKAVINLSALEKRFDDGDVVNPTTLLEKKLIRRSEGTLPIVKILATGKLTKKLSFDGVEFSKSAKEAIEGKKSSTTKEPAAKAKKGSSAPKKRAPAKSRKK